MIRSERINHLHILDDREKEVVIGRFGLVDENERTQREIAKELGISRSYVSRIEKRALMKLFNEFYRASRMINIYDARQCASILLNIA